MDVLERVALLRRDNPNLKWTSEDFLKAALEGKRRHDEIADLFEISYSVFTDVLPSIAPDWRLLVDEAPILSVPKINPRIRYSQILLGFVKWEYCPLTKGLPNPYEPWNEILEHGGSFQVEHAEFIDLFDEHGWIGGICVNRSSKIVNR
jgi:hypothetical protein